MTTRHPSTQVPLLHAFCHRCERWRVLEADAFAVEFAVDEGTPAVARCPDCGEFGLVKVRLPATQTREAGLLVLEEPPHDPRYLL